MPETETTEPEIVAVPSRPSREPLFGALLFGVLIIVAIASIAGAGYAAYAGWKKGKEQSARPSIADLAVKSEESVPTETPAALPKEEAPAVPTAEAKLRDIAVLNGGAAKGIAAKVADLLKKEGYTKVTAGNTVSDYTGVAVYYAAGLEKEAETLRLSLAASYPNAATKPVVAGNKETSVSPLTVIIGK